MKREGYRLTLIAAALLALVSVRHAVGQAPVAVSPDALSIQGIEAGTTKTPVYNQRSQVSARDEVRDWFRIEVEYRTEPDWMDEITFTYYVLLRNDALAVRGDPRSPFRLLRGQVTNVNIPKARRSYSVMFIHPRTLERFGGVERIAVVATSGGVVLETSTQPDARTRWWEELPPVDGLMLNRLETPFALIAYDRYEAIKSEATAR